MLLRKVWPVLNNHPLNKLQKNAQTYVCTYTVNSFSLSKNCKIFDRLFYIKVTMNRINLNLIIKSHYFKRITNRYVIIRNHLIKYIYIQLSNLVFYNWPLLLVYYQSSTCKSLGDGVYRQLDVYEMDFILRSNVKTMS